MTALSPEVADVTFFGLYELGKRQKEKKLVKM